MIAQEPLDISEIRSHLRLDVVGTINQTLEDAELMAMAQAARDAAENYTGLTIANRQETISVSKFPAKEINLETWPVSEVISVTYKDQSGNLQTLSPSAYILDSVSKPAKLYPVNGWPAAQDAPFPITITVQAGFTDGLSPNPYPIPASLKHSLLLMVGHFYATREAVGYTQTYEVPMSATYLMTPHRIEMGM
jgi:uncharacterized phiE125 gp8 family phage protein